jgi:tetratricopeptide (TPR) repeat protein
MVYLLALLLSINGQDQLQAATTLNGVILYNELGGSAAAGVEVSAFGANLTETGRDGHFLLIFHRAHPGDRVLVTVKKSGFAVVNYFELHVVLPRDSKSDPMTILICRDGEREGYAENYYRLASRRAIEESFNRRIQELANENRATKLELAKAQEERDHALAVSDTAARELAKLKPHDTNEIYDKAMALFTKGDINAALETLGYEQMKSPVENAEKRKVDAESEVTKAVQGYFLKGQLLITQLRFKEARESYATAVRLAPDNLEAQFHLAWFDDQTVHLEESRSEYLRALELSRSAGGARLALILAGLGSISMQEHHLSEAREELEQALTAIQSASPVDVPDEVVIIYKLGIVRQFQGHYVEAKLQFERALEIVQNEAKKSAFEKAYYDGLTAALLNGLGIVDADPKKAREQFEAARQILNAEDRNAAGRDSENAVPAIINLANLDRKEGLLEESLKKYQFVVTIRRQEVEKDPDFYFPELFNALLNMSSVEILLKRLQDARVHSEECVSIFREHMNTSPALYSGFFGEAIENVAGFEFDDGEFEAACRDYREALAAYRRAEAATDDRYTLFIARTEKSLKELAQYTECK